MPTSQRRTGSGASRPGPASRSGGAGRAGGGATRRARSVVDDDVLEVLHQVARSGLGRKFYLAGGTALALQIGHRRSNDLDYFVDADQLDRSITKALLDRPLPREIPQEVVLNERGQVDLAVGPRRRKVTFVAYPFPSSRAKVVVEGQRCADVLEIAAMKAYTIGRRGTARDYADIEAALSRGSVSLADIIAVAKGRFVLDGEPVFSERMFLQQLVYTDDLEDKDSLAGLGTSFGEVERSLRRLVAEHVRSRLR